jgi:hypothetical protein
VPDEIGGHRPPYRLADRVSLRVKRSNLIGREHRFDIASSRRSAQ